MPSVRGVPLQDAFLGAKIALDFEPTLFIFQKLHRFVSVSLCYAEVLSESNSCHGGNTRVTLRSCRG